jgi:hypothetical protein
MQTRFFLRISLGVLAANLYAKGQVENAPLVSPPSMAVEDVEEAAAPGEQELQEDVKVRDPFWPVGYVPPVVKVQRQSSTSGELVDETKGHVDFSGLTKEEQAVIKSRMVVGGILKQGSTCLAIINQQLVNEGEELSLKSEDKTYRFGVKKLTPDKILLESMQE